MLKSYRVVQQDDVGSWSIDVEDIAWPNDAWSDIVCGDELLGCLNARMRE